VSSLVVATNGDGAWMSTLRGEPRATTVWIHAGSKVQVIDTGHFRPKSLRLTDDGRSIDYDGYDGYAKGWSRFFDFACSVHRSLVVCANSFGDAMRYKPVP